MRDGFLPLQCLKALDRELNAHAAEVSRFTAIASSFRSEVDVVDYLGRFANNANVSGTGKQLLLLDAEIANLERVTKDHRGSAQALLHAMRKFGLIQKICERSMRFANRMFAHLRKEAGIEAGDRIVFVDLGYSGTVQTKIQHVLEKGLNVQVEGRYLLLRDVPEATGNKQGLIEPSNTDPRAIDAMCAHIAILEQICTVEQASVIDYQDDGTSIRRTSEIKGRQSATRHRVQKACTDFICLVRENPVSLPAAVDRQGWARAASAMLTRFIYMPTPNELATVTGFEHDVNMGTKKTVRLFDPVYADAGAKSRGLCYLNGTDRLYLPAEVRSLGMPSSLMLLAQRRLGLELKREDFGHQSKTLPIMVVNDSQSFVSEVIIEPTHDGYWLAVLPVTEKPSSFGLMFGSRYCWVQLERAELIPIQRLFVDGGERAAVDLRYALTHENIAVHDGGLLECKSEQSFSFIAPQAGTHGKTIAIVFRPIVERMPAMKPAPAVQAAELMART
jgi:hypothetical protein